MLSSLEFQQIDSQEYSHLNWTSFERQVDPHFASTMKAYFSNEVLNPGECNNSIITPFANHYHQ